MFPTAPTLSIVTVIIAIGVISTIGFSWIWIAFAVTLIVTTAIAIHRSIPRKER
ncbi:hypothetical protein [Baekduia soli]|uniref:hypothetical protein n=1 Tax=Baekduia soli TaxID=496014 RepID=UPI001651C435|nr:hypothetical protein [Baekduia soli]